MKQLAFLEQELIILQENINRLKEFKKEHEKNKWTPYSSRVVGELKHRIVSLKQRLTLVSKMNTSDLF